ncbi:S8 family serine peptidase [Streptomyces sp. NPDC051020]|uniref:S8 family serine peptidase n=1 Tax=Streptomyces sp. NPDC051020 TaxID=3155409 RepID=UPI003420147D
MREQGSNGVKPGNGKGGKTPRAQDTAGEAGQPAAAGGAGEPAERMGGEAHALGYQGRGVRAGWGRYLVAPRPLGLLAGGVPPIEASALFKLLEEDPDVEPVAQVQPSRSRGLGAIAEPHPACPPVAVVKMPQERARALAGNPQVVVEIDQPLSYTPTPPVGVGPMPVVDPMLAVTLEEPEHLTLRVVGSDGDAVAGAHVWAIGTGGPVHGVTGQDGRVTMTLAADTPETLQALYVRPVADYWPARTGTPQPADNGEAVVTVQALSDTFEGFPGKALTGWGAQAMRLNQIPPTYRGHGIKIALLDSGVNTAHPDLKDPVQHGHDFTGAGNGTWGLDVTGHGTRCAGIIAAADNNAGIAGIAAEAEVHALKLFPGGHLSDLLEAVDYCITHDIDIAQISLAYPVQSQLAAWKLADAHAAGTTVIAPAGDTAGPLTQLATLPGVLAVGAIAHTGTYPVSSPLTWVQPPWPAGPYPAPFTPTGPGVDLVAPGAAVITTSLGDGYAAVDGTAIAAAHVTGLAALLLAHHDHLRTQAVPRTAARADLLYLLVRTACRPLPGADPRLGAGIADAPTALGIPASWQQAEQYTPAGPHQRG